MHAVIIDDDSVIRRLLGKVLIDKGYEVTSYSNPLACPLHTEESCPCSWKDSCPDLIVTDYDMPDVNGVAFVEKLQRKKCKSRNIAMISGSWVEHDLQQVLPAGVSVFSKPIHLKRFLAWVDSIKRLGAEAAGRVNRRSSVRYPCEVPLDAYFSSAGLLEVVKAVARNISRGGLLMACSEALNPTALCQLSFTVPEWLTFKTGVERDVMVSARVCHSNATSGVHGFQFLEPIA